MNRQDALSRCKAIRDYLTNGNPIWDKDEVYEAMTMAIEALKKETGCDGCRQLQIHCFECARRRKDYYKGVSE